MPFASQPRAVLTGAGSGLGRALALALAGRGARLVLSDLDEGRLAEVEALARARGATDVACLRVDVGQLDQVEALASAAGERFGGTDILVNNAGVAVAGPVGEVRIEDWRWQLEVNLWGVIHGCHVFLPEMRARGSGFILNVASAAGLLSAPWMAPYNVTKSGVVALSRTMRSELRGSGVSVSVLCPTFFQSDIHISARSSRPEIGRATEKLVTRSKWSSERIAQVALRGLERRKLHILPQLDARLFWRLQRIWPAGVQWLLGVLHAADALNTLTGPPEQDGG